ncbi:MAG TPA: PepSY domain-containing protein [bacterium]
MKPWFMAALAVFFAAPPVKSEEPHSPGRIILMEEARELALKAESGKIEYGELQAREDKWIYSFEILGTDKKIHEIDLDAHTGKLTGKHLEPLPMWRE